jgi:hypothetical protein
MMRETIRRKASPHGHLLFFFSFFASFFSLAVLVGCFLVSFFASLVFIGVWGWMLNAKLVGRALICDVESWSVQAREKPELRSSNILIWYRQFLRRTAHWFLMGTADGLADAQSPGEKRGVVTRGIRGGFPGR